MKLAIIDIDGIIADSSKRFESVTENGKINWDRALSSELLHLDELIPQAVEHLALIAKHYDQTILLTSRYDHMREATLNWLSDHGIMMAHVDRAIFKSYDHDRYRKTKLWKAEQVIKILREATGGDLWSRLPQNITALLIVEDNESNQEEIKRVLQAQLEYSIFCSSLQEATEKGITL